MRKGIPAALFTMLSIALLLFAPAYAVPADDDDVFVVFSNLRDASTPGGFAVGLYPFPPPTFNSYALGFPFTPAGSDFRLTQVAVLTSLVHGTNDLLITLYTDSSGSPGTPLESWSVVNQLGATVQILSVRSLLHPKHVNGQQYWLVVTMAVPSSEGIWWINPIGDVRTQAASINGGPFALGPSLSSAFQIRGRRSEDLD